MSWFIYTWTYIIIIVILLFTIAFTVAIDYLGHSEKNTGNWCFKDGTINYQDLVTLYMQHCPGKLLTIQSDCCYSGQWVIDCARFLDSFGITPCGHRARERKLLLRVFASCQPTQKAVEPCYSIEVWSMKRGWPTIKPCNTLTKNQYGLVALSYCVARAQILPVPVEHSLSWNGWMQ